MSRYEKALQRLLSGTADLTIRYDELCGLLSRLGFADRQRGGAIGSSFETASLRS